MFAPACDGAHSSRCIVPCLSRQRSGKHRDHKRACLSAGRSRERRIRYAPCKRCTVCIWSACTRHILSRLANLLEDVLVPMARPPDILSEACKDVYTGVTRSGVGRAFSQDGAEANVAGGKRHAHTCLIVLLPSLASSFAWRGGVRGPARPCRPGTPRVRRHAPANGLNLVPRVSCRLDVLAYAQ